MSKRKKITLVPRLRFPEFRHSSEWTKTELCVLADKVVTRNRDNLVNRVLTNSALDGVVDQSDYFDRDIANHNNLENYYVIDKGDYVYNPRISVTAPVGPISKNKIGRGVMSPLYTVFRFKSAKNDFYEQYFKTNLWHDYLKGVSNTGARHDRMNISNDSFFEMPLPCSAEEEQQKIADCLSSLDELIIAEDRKLSALRDHKKGLMQKLFPAGDRTVPEWRFSEFKNSGKWLRKSLSKLCDMKSGKFIQATRIYESQKDNMYPCYGGNGLRGYAYSFTHSGKYSLIGRQGALCGNVTFVSGDFHATEHAIVATEKHNICAKWLYFLLIKMKLNQFATGQAQPGLSVQALEKIETYVPNIMAEQQKIADCLSSIDELISMQTEKIETLKAHKKGLMQGLFPSIKEVSE